MWCKSIIDLTLWVVLTSLLILQTKDQYVINNLVHTIIPLAVMTIFLIISAIQYRFQLKLVIFENIRKLITLTVLAYEPLNNNNNNTIEQIIKIKYVILGVYFSHIVQLDQKQITWRKLIINSIYTYISLIVIIVTQTSKDYEQKLIFLIIFTMPFEIFLFFLISKKTTIKLDVQKVLQYSENLNRSINVFRETQRQMQYDESQPELFQKYSQCLKNQIDVYKLFFDHFPYGMIQLDDQEQIIHINPGLNEIFNQNDDIKVLQELFGLQNCTQEFFEEDQFKKLFRGLEQKLSSSLDKVDLQNETPILNDFNKQESLNVRNEYLKAIKIARTKIIESPKKIQINEFFVFKSKLICRLEDGSKEIIEEQKQLDEFNIQPVIENQNKIIEVTIKAFIQDGEAIVWIMVRDVTFFNELNVQKQINQNKSKMLSQVAHEFRTPLNCIILLSENSIEKNQKNLTLVQQYLQPILTSANQLLSLVNDLLDITQLRAGKFKIVNQQFDIILLMNDIFKMLLPLATARNLYLLLDIAQNIPKIFTSDPNRIRQIIMNLISNSLKFTFRGGITLTLTFQSLNYYQISVYDTGIGIDIEDQSRLFQAFGKIEKTQHLNQQGVGLGLMISHIMAQRLSQSYQDEKTQGLIANSEGKNKGSLFYFVIFDHTNVPEINNHIILKKGNTVQFDLQNFQISQKKLLSPSQVWNGINIQQDNQFQGISENNINLSQSFKKEKEIIKQISIQYIDSSFIQIQGRMQKRKIQLQPLNIRIQGESHEEFSPKSLTSKNKNLPNNRYWFKQCRCKELLIIDDQPFNIQALTLSLDNFNLKIASVNSNYQTVKLLDEIKSQLCCQWIRIILMDLEMPISDGFETTINIRNMEKVIRLTNKNFLPAYIIGCSGHGLEHRQKCLNSGMDDYLTKPVRKMDLINIIERLVKNDQQL